MRQRKRSRSRAARVAVAAEEERRGREAGEGDRDGDADQRRLVVVALPAPRSGSGSIGSRKCGIARKPPTADSAASTTSTPVIDSGDSWTWCSTSWVIRERAEEREPQQAEHVERRQQRGERPRRARAASSRRGRSRTRTRGSRPWRRSRPAAGCRRSPRWRSAKVDEGDRDLPREPAHLPDVLLAGQRVDHAAGAEEQAGLEERVRVDVEDRDAVGADAERHEHEAELRDRRVGEHLLDVGLRRPRSSRRRSAVRAPIAGDQRRGLRRVQVDARQARDQVDAGGHHRRRVDQRRDRRRAGHRVGQPDVERDLRRLAGGADEQQDADEARRDRGQRRGAMNAALIAVHVERAERSD